MKKDPLVTTIKLLHNLNLLETDNEINIHQFKTLFHSDLHWVTIQKYLKIITLIQKYCPMIELEDSKLSIREPKIYKHFNLKEQVIAYLFLRNARDKISAIPLPQKYDQKEVYKAIGRLYEKTNNNKYFLKPLGIEIYKTLNSIISEVILDEKEIAKVFEYNPVTEEQPIASIEAEEEPEKNRLPLLH